jgi:hypothetical protein
MHSRSRRLASMAVVLASTTATSVDAEALTLTRLRQSRYYTSKSVPGSRRGRPRKFGRPSRAVTLTLPDDVIAALQGIDTDLSRAIVRATQPLVPTAPSPPAELFSYGDRSVIIVPRSKVLRERTGVELVPLSDGRALISMDYQLSVPQLELQLTDAIADPTLDAESRGLFETLVDILRKARKDDAFELRERHIIILQHKNGGNSNATVNNSGNGDGSVDPS